VSEIDLRYSTDDPEVDRIVRGYVGVFETALPGSVRAYYLTGSYAEGTAASTSDIDVVIAFRDGAAPAADGVRQALWLEKYCNLLSPIPVGAGRYPEAQLLEFGHRGRSWPAYDGIGRRVSLKLAGHLLYGEDLRDRIPVPPVEWWARACWAELGVGALRNMGQLRSRRDLTLARDVWLDFPLRYPDPGGDCFGYDGIRRPTRAGGVRNTTRGLVRAILRAANAMVAWKGRRCVANKGEVARAYGEVIGGAWAGLVAALDQTCRVELGYLVPEDGAARRRLRGVLAEALALENHFLGELRDVLLEEVDTAQAASGWLPAELAGWLLDLSPDQVQGLAKTGVLPVRMDNGRRLVAERPCLEAWVATMFGRVRYPGDERIGAALARLASADTEVVRQAARASLAALRGAGSR
jgi:hypothetical protein